MAQLEMSLQDLNFPVNRAAQCSVPTNKGIR